MEVIAQEIPPVTIQPDPNPMIQIMDRLSKFGDLSQLAQLMAIQRQYEADEAWKSFVKAMTEFKSNPPKIKRDMKNSQYNSQYTSLGCLVNSSLPAMSKCGLSHRWEIKQDDKISVSCIVTHYDGHGESVTMSAPPDLSGKKNPIQQVKSTITYLKGVTFESIMGLASSDLNFDDDGNAAAPEYISEKQLSQILDMINSKNINMQEFLKYAGATTAETILASKFNEVISALKGAKAK